jgi:hypothetical protein
MAKGKGRRDGPNGWAPRRYINHKRKFIWFKNPKAGSTSILKILYDEGLIHKRPLHNVQKGDGFAFYKKDQRADYFKFGFVRNPWDRLVSVFEDKTKKVIGTRWSMKFYRKYKNHNFPDFAKAIAGFGEKKLLRLDRHIRPQFSNLNDLVGLDFIGRLENFKEDVTFAMGEIGIEVYPNQIPQKNKVPREFRHYSEYYDDETIKIVSDMYKKDIELFGYKFGD